MLFYFPFFLETRIGAHVTVSGQDRTVMVIRIAQFPNGKSLKVYGSSVYQSKSTKQHCATSGLSDKLEKGSRKNAADKTRLAEACARRADGKQT